MSLSNTDVVQRQLAFPSRLLRSASSRLHFPASSPERRVFYLYLSAATGVPGRNPTLAEPLAFEVWVFRERLVRPNISSRPTLSPSHLPPSLSHFTYFSYPKYRAEAKRPSAPIPALICSSTSSSSSITIAPSDDPKTHPSLTQPRPYLASRTPRNPHADAHRALAYPRPAFLRDGQLPLLAVFSRDWNVDEPRTRMAFNWK
ncbi:hypothetical protein K443DRAFT_640989 [Laccaria amethystina LaAM-08-1]|uniref:Uncharacterized protein n=1 Tax=Laccaria amethystina LaAM-08-1 TaxID=1095629 RepID=A0A0C9X051_9AGAR|nr:hypothetical protein K443DRAFT_640989 [Laccaria amethystina LaAM-08-1]